MSFNIFDYEWKLIETKPCQCTFNEYFNAVEIWLTKPHVLNRQVCTSQMMWRKELTNTNLLSFLEDFLSSDSKWTETERSGTDDHSSKQMECCLRRLLPRKRNSEVATDEIIVIDHSTASIMFLPIEDSTRTSTSLKLENIIKHAGYKLQFNENEHSLKLFVGQEYKAPSTRNFATPSIPWLKTHLMPKLLKWATESNANSGNSFTSLVSMDEYSQLYSDLKEKYGAKFVKLWTEVTDPLKFVYEDVAIAAYILTLWRHERDERGLTTPQSFIDLGCGNGLLVHILNCEGHRGKGIDVRRRKIWDIYGGETFLEEAAITPSDTNLFPEYDWLIGNHSDELTPWIPVIASRSSFDTRYFVLPCCFHDFNCKFARTDSRQGQYRAYLDFVSEIGKTCGFEVLEDRLRIPSTKRICQVGRKRMYKPEEQTTIDLQIKELIRKRSCTKRTTGVSKSLDNDMQMSCTPGSDGVSGEHDAVLEVTGLKRELDSAADNEACCQKMKCIEQTVNISDDQDLSADDANKWVVGFTAREKVERVRNCATVSWDLRQEIVSKVAFRLLEEGGVDLNAGRDAQCLEKGWRRGGRLDLPAIAGFLGSDTLKKLKQECGGLKTLLKNANQVFEVSGNTVQVRDWTKSDLQPAKSNESLKKTQDRQSLFKTKHCWFHDNHPDGCPRTIRICPFAHGADDLKERPNFK